jgi:two-component system sensor histidine kinase HydH
METILAKALGQDLPLATAEEKRLLLSRLLGRLAHEIRNPLSSLDIHLQLFEEDLDEMAPQAKAKLASRLDVIHGELHRLDAIVEQFLRLAGPSAPDLAPVDLAKIIGHVCDVLQPEAATREIEIVTRPADNLPLVPADADQLIQATLNLVINALQAVDRRGRVELGAMADGDGVVLEVRDTGPGVTVGNLGTIFEPYFTTKAEGSGLGLWIAQQIIAAHGGTIRAANAPGGGAVFSIHLPLRRRNTEHGQIED